MILMYDSPAGERKRSCKPPKPRRTSLRDVAAFLAGAPRCPRRGAAGPLPDVDGDEKPVGERQSLTHRSCRDSTPSLTPHRLTDRVAAVELTARPRDGPQSGRGWFHRPEWCRSAARTPQRARRPVILGTGTPRPARSPDWWTYRALSRPAGVSTRPGADGLPCDAGRLRHSPFRDAVVVDQRPDGCRETFGRGVVLGTATLTLGGQLA